MMIRRFAVVIVALVACRDPDPVDRVPLATADARPDAPPDRITGSIVVEDQAITPATCRVGRDAHLYVELPTPHGTLRFANATLVWNRAVLTCSKLDRSWGGGSRTDGTHYWRGTLDFVCGSVTGKLALDCGGITPGERAQLDQGRAQSQQQP
ncbi:MAG: hypothetical protein WKG01_09345 [Kofleriaceae bacterium]